MKKKLVRIVEEEFVCILREEWKRAKSLRPLMTRQQPNYYWIKSDGNVVAMCFKKTLCRNQRPALVFSDRYLKYGIKDDCFVETVRHEIAHINTTHHGEAFKRALKILGGHRYANSDLAAFAEAESKSKNINK
jgi:hypothetical protein